MPNIGEPETASPASPSLAAQAGAEDGVGREAASARIGRFELAEGGVIFLDEVDEMPPSTQVRLLRVLQEGCYEKVGGDKTITADVRVIADSKARATGLGVGGDGRSLNDIELGRDGSPSTATATIGETTTIEGTTVAIDIEATKVRYQISSTLQQRRQLLTLLRVGKLRILQKIKGCPDRTG